MQNDTITVYYKGSGLLVFKAVAEPLKLTNGQNIKTEAHFWEVLNANASFGISKCQHEMQEKQN